MSSLNLRCTMSQSQPHLPEEEIESQRGSVTYPQSELGSGGVRPGLGSVGQGSSRWGIPALE